MTRNGKKRTLVYVLSPSFSGSTLLTLMLAQHPQMATIGELKATAMGATEDYSCSCGDPIRVCPFWQRLTSRCQEKGLLFQISNFGTHFTSSNRLVDRVLRAQVRGPFFELLRRGILEIPTCLSNYYSILERNMEMIDLICDLQASDVFLDASKDPQRLMYFRHSGYWDIYVIKMYRDGRAQSNSRRQKPRNPVDFEGAAKEWRDTVRQMDRVCSLFEASRVHTLYYESLCAKPNVELDKIWRFLNLDALHRNWTNLDLKSETHHILGNKMRTQSGVRISSTSKWRKQVTERELGVFEAIAGKMNRSLGYVDLPNHER